MKKNLLNYKDESILKLQGGRMMEMQTGINISAYSESMVVLTEASDIND